MTLTERIAKIICCGNLPCGGCSGAQYETATRRAQAAISAIEASGTHVVAPVVADDEMKISGWCWIEPDSDPMIAMARAWSAMIAARPKVTG